MQDGSAQPDSMQIERERNEVMKKMVEVIEKLESKQAEPATKGVEWHTQQ